MIMNISVMIVEAASFFLKERVVDNNNVSKNGPHRSPLLKMYLQCKSYLLPVSLKAGIIA